jgi:gliding motility-associated-like protein
LKVEIVSFKSKICLFQIFSTTLPTFVLKNTSECHIYYTTKLPMKKIFLLFLFVIATEFVALAQTCPAFPGTAWSRGSFAVPATVCLNQVMTVTETPGFTNIKYVYDFRGGTNYTTGADTKKTHTYTATGIYIILQIATDRNNKQSWACNRVQVVATPTPTFTATNCQAAIVQVKLKTQTPALTYNTYAIDWGDGSAVTNFTTVGTTSSHAYSDNKSHTVKMSGRYMPANCGADFSLPITPTGTPPVLPVFTKAEVIDKTTVELTYQNPSGSTYELYQRITSQNQAYQRVPITPTKVGTDYKYRITNLKTDQSTYAFQLWANLTCGTSVVSIKSLEIGTIPFQIVLVNYQNNLYWQGYPITTDFKQYTILRDDKVLITRPLNTNVYFDQTAKCGQTYKYRIQVDFKAAITMTSLSLPIEVKTLPTNDPPALKDFVVSIGAGNHPTIQINDVLKTEKIKTYYYYRKNGAKFDTVGHTNYPQSLFADNQINAADGSACYKVTYQNVCDKTSPLPDSVCTIFLKDDKGEKLFWTSPLPFQPTLTGYKVEKVDDKGVTKTAYDVAKNHDWVIDTQDPEQEVGFRVKATSSASRISLSNVVKVVKPMKVFMPNAFSPNGDSIHEKLEVVGLYIKNARFVVYNRTGNTIFSSDDFFKTGWDGITSDGSLVEAGTYTYVLQAIDIKGTAITRTGDLTILR